MSGILGVWNRDGRPVTRGEVERLAATLRHRGQDAQGIELRGGVGFASCLLRVTPTARAEAQPFVGASGEIVVFDGRLDNRAEILGGIAPSLALAGDAPDPDLVWAAYRTFGDGFAERLAGDFALAIFDPRRHTLLLVRDPIGVRPLYYYAKGDLFAFASEIKTLVAHPDIPSSPADEVVADFLLNRLAADDRLGLTFVQNVCAVLPAHVVTVTPRGVTSRRYWDFDCGRVERFGSPDEYASAFRHYFEQAVRRRLRSAGPVAISVSGGLDSSSIFCVAEASRRQDPATPPLLGISYTAPDGAAWDEKAFLADIERQYDIHIDRLDNVGSGLLDGAPEAVWHVEAPFLDAQWSGTHAYMRAIRERGARVLLTGHWGDQVLFDTGYLTDLLRRGRWREAWRHVDEYGRWLNLSDPGALKRQALRRLAVSLLPASIVPSLRMVRDRFVPNRAAQSWYSARVAEHASRCRARGRPPGPEGSAHARALYWEVRSRYHVLCMEWNNKVGLMHGIDMAFVFLDRDLLQFLMAIPGEVQMQDGVPKAILRTAMRGVVPEPIRGRRSKADFTAVVNAGMSAELDQILQCIGSSSLIARRDYVNQEALSRELSRVASTLAGSSGATSLAVADLVALELWLRAFFGDRTVSHRAETL